MRDWQNDADRFIQQVHDSLPADATLTQRRAALRKVAADFHLFTGWGQKVWSKKVRKYLEQHGLEPLKPRHDPYAGRDDICFPFRNQVDSK